MRVYMDVCCLNRPFDDLSQDKVRFESEAVISILKRCNFNDDFKLIGGDIIFFEVSKTKDPLKKAGLMALKKELGPLGMALFIRQFDNGYGNYTAERDELLKDITLEDIEQEFGLV